MARLLVCPPDHFGIEYEINPWMRVSDATDSEKSKAQWHNLAHVLEHDVGAKLERMTPVKGLPDLVFTANAGVLHEGKAVISRFRHPERQG
ncbi:MAG: amidinotransferase, partial [Nitrospirota bacterium]|nr:amidinotransferase [Nitrospirota bacterium]